MKTARMLLAGLMLTCLLASTSAVAGVLDPECTPEKAAKGAAAKATVGVGGRCKPGETVKDSGKRAVGADDDEKNDDNDDNDGNGVAKRAADKAKND